MKLAEALTRRTALAELIPARHLTWYSCVGVSSPFKHPDVLLQELNDLLTEQEDLVKRINRTNVQTGPTGKKPIELIAHKEALSLKLMILRDLYNASQIDTTRYSNKEIKLVSTIEPKTVQKQIDRLAKELRETTLELQQLNWNMELLP